MVRGKLNKQIAHQLGTSERTVKAHRHMVMQKLQVQSFAEAVSIAERVGQLTPPPSSDAKGVHRASLRSTISFSHLVAGLSNRKFAPKDNIAPRRAVVCCGRVEPSRCAVKFRGVSMHIDQWLAAVEETPFTRQGKPWSDLVEQAERLALAHIDEPLHISALCRTLKVSERTLRKAFHKACGLAPCRHLRMLRLSQARRALMCADAELVTVTEVATCFGFVELARFSVEYRKVFGECPSQTLHRTSPGGAFSGQPCCPGPSRFRSLRM
jgi:AraC-like DNA-binding protein